MKTIARILCLSGLVGVALATPAAAQSTPTVGQISGVASLPGKGTLAGVTVQLRDLTTKQVIATITTNASGQFVFVVDHPGSFIVEILGEEGAVVGTTAPIVLSPGAMIVAAVSVSPTASSGAAGAAAAAGAQGEQGQGNQGAQGSGVGAMAVGGISGSLFMPTLPSVASAATGSGIAAGTVPSRGTVSPSR